jgi:hypothetical protein
MGCKTLLVFAGNQAIFTFENVTGLLEVPSLATIFPDVYFIYIIAAT